MKRLMGLSAMTALALATAGGAPHRTLPLEAHWCTAEYLVLIDLLEFYCAYERRVTPPRAAVRRLNTAYDALERCAELIPQTAVGRRWNPAVHCEALQLTPPFPQGAPGAPPTRSTLPPGDPNAPRPPSYPTLRLI